MKTIRQESIKVVHIENTPKKEEMEQGIIYVSKKYKGSSHLCLCGCGTECYLPLNENGWAIVESEKGLSVTPSILQRFDCKSHYIITNSIANFV